MESEAIQLLKEIRQILYWIGAVISIGIAFWIARSTSSVWFQFKNSMREEWKNQAADYFDKADYDNLLIHCQERLSSFPNDSRAIWWLARYYTKKDNLEKANELFAKVLELEPTWKEEYVDPYMSPKSGNPANKPLKNDAEKRAL